MISLAKDVCVNFFCAEVQFSRILARYVEPVRTTVCSMNGQNINNADNTIGVEHERR